MGRDVPEEAGVMLVFNTEKGALSLAVGALCSLMVHPCEGTVIRFGRDDLCDVGGNLREAKRAGAGRSDLTLMRQGGRRTGGRRQRNLMPSIRQFADHRGECRHQIIEHPDRRPTFPHTAIQATPDSRKANADNDIPLQEKRQPFG